MTPTTFCYWLQGLIERDEGEVFNREVMTMMRDNLRQVIDDYEEQEDNKDLH